jgi:hypothetical protein
MGNFPKAGRLDEGRPKTDWGCWLLGGRVVMDGDDEELEVVQ